MSVQFTWDNPERTVGRYDFVGKWTWEEMYQAFHQSWDEIAQQPFIVDSISDFTQTNNVPVGPMTHLRILAKNRPENTGAMIFVGANRYLTVIVQSFKQLYNAVLQRELQVEFVKTLDEARVVAAQRHGEQER